MTRDLVIYQKEDGFAVATLNRPERLNSLTRAVLQGLLEVCHKVESDPAVRALILTGAPRPDGRPCFCSGLDLKDFAERARREGTNVESIALEVRPVWARIEKLKKPTIAAIDGVCSAGGMVMALCCDFRVVAETAQIADFHIKHMGIIGGDAPGVRLARIVGSSKAKEIMFLGDFIDGKEACEIGLANRCFPPGELMEGARSMARKIAGMRSAAISLAKESIDAAESLSLEQAYAFADKCNALLDTAEGALAFSEKRAPRFTD